MIAFRPGWSVRFMHSSPVLTIYRFSPVNGATSATVPSDASSNSRSGTGRPWLLYIAWASLSAMPTPVREACG